MRNIGFAQRFADACREVGLDLKQESLGRFFGVSGPMAWNYLKGEKLPGMPNAIRIAQKLGVCVEWLLTGRGPRYPAAIAHDDLVDISGLPPRAKAAIKSTVEAFKVTPNSQG